MLYFVLVKTLLLSLYTTNMLCAQVVQDLRVFLVALGQKETRVTRANQFTALRVPKVPLDLMVLLVVLVLLVSRVLQVLKTTQVSLHRTKC